MGEFSSARWIVGLLLYFIGFFTVMYSVVGMNNIYNFDSTNSLKSSDPGFSTVDNQPYAQGGKCDGTPYWYCEKMGIQAYDACQEFFPYNCNWLNASNGGPTVPITVVGICFGSIHASCSNFTDARMCQTIGCTWTDYTNVGTSNIENGFTGSFDWDTVKLTVANILGYRATIGIPSGWQWLFSLVFFYIEFVMFVLALYYAMPFIH